jgi:NIMA (never in mitosis gene a)-related kinase 1/4/5
MRDKFRKKFVCVKIIKIKNIPKKEREATKVEVELLKRLNHPNIVRYIDSFLSQNSESLCIAMEYCDGGDLASQVKAARRKLFSEDKILHWFVQIALGVHYMHTKNVLHRDLKTQNIFLLGNGRLVLGDLGISKVLEGTMDFAQTCIGTPYYMSPEIFKNKPYSYKSDVWALGCVLYELTTLNHAFDANSLNGLAQKIIKGRYPPIDARYSRYLRELIAHMLLPEPKQRPDLDEILRKPFIRKHILQFFQDINQRPTEGIGEGTMIVRAAVGGPIAGNVGNDVNMLGLREQLESLGMTQILSEAMAPISQKVPQDESEAIKIAKDAANALKREKDHRNMVASALEKLRLERENRAKERIAQGAQGRRIEPARVAPNALKKDGPPVKPAALRQPRPDGVKYDGGGGAQGIAIPVPAQPQIRVRSDSAAAAAANLTPPTSAGRGKRQSEARDRIEERERRQRELAEKEKADEMKAQKERDDAARQRKEEILAKAARDQARAQADIVARREAQRDRERRRQAEEIEQLKKDKLELDRRSRDRDMQREQRRKEEKQRLEDVRKEQIDNMQDKLNVMNEQVSRLDVGRRAEEKSEGRDRGQRKQDRQAKEDSSSGGGGGHHRGVSADRKEDERMMAPSSKQDRKSGGLDELTAKLHNARGAPRYDNQPSHGGDDDEDDSDSDNDTEEMWGDADPNDAEEEDEIMHRREEELQAELSLATKRCQELKETLQVTKSFIGGRGGNEGAKPKIAVDIIADDGSDEELEEVDEYEDDEAVSAMTTVRERREPASSSSCCLLISCCRIHGKHEAQAQ